MNHKRKGPKSTRAGCLLCKPHKRQGVDDQGRQELRGREDEREQLEEIFDGSLFDRDALRRAETTLPDGVHMRVISHDGRRALDLMDDGSVVEAMDLQ